MTLDEAIRHAEEVANTNERLCETVRPAMQLSDYGKCAEEHRQLAAWLKELKAYRKRDSDAISRLSMNHILNHETKWMNELMIREGVRRMTSEQAQDAESFDMAIKALEQEQSGDAISRDKVIVQLSHLLSDWDDDWNVGIRKCIETVKSVPPVTQKICEDVISRQAVISAIMREYPDAHYPSYYKSKIDELPSVTLHQRTGRWEQTRYRSIDQIGESYDDGIGFRCSNCANVFKVTSLIRYHFCPNCGAEMEVAKECQWKTITNLYI